MISLVFSSVYRNTLDGTKMCGINWGMIQYALFIVDIVSSMIMVFRVPETFRYTIVRLLTNFYLPSLNE